MDAGKTTTTEQMLYLADSIRTLGRVDDGTTQLDSLQVERERGISVRMAATVLPWKGCQINLVDTPGHTDFVAEVERAFRVLDGAVLIISAAEGVQAHTETLWHALRALRLPTLLFINKLDRFGADPSRVLAQIRTRLTDRAVPIQALPPAEQAFQGVTRLPDALLLEQLAELDDTSLGHYLEGSEGIARGRLAELTRGCTAFPVLYGASLKGIGMAELLDAALELLPPPPDCANGAPAGVVFKVERDPVMGRLAYIRLYSGTLRARDRVLVAGRSEPGRAATIRKMHAKHLLDVGALTAGDIGVISGLGQIRAGDVLGDPALVPPALRMAVPVLRVRLRPGQPEALPRLLGALEELTGEDPQLAFQWLPDLRELNVTVMGPVQVEILQSLLRERFGLTARFDPPSVIYRETPVGTGIGQAKLQLKGLADLSFQVEPGPPGSGLQLANRVLHDQLYPQFAEEALRTAAQTLQQGLVGWQVTDAVLSLTAGDYCPITSTLGCFTGVAPMAAMSALAESKTRLLEPTYAFRISIPAESGGKIMGELVRMRGTLDTPVAAGDRLLLEGTLPVATSLSFPARLSGLTSGRGLLTLQPGEYQPAPESVQAERPRAGVNPLDRSRYLLSLRGALTD